MKKYEEIEHTADLKVRIYGRDMPDLFANASWALAELLAEPERLSFQEERTLSLEAEDYSMLLVDWLSEILYLLEIEGTLFVARRITRLRPTRISAILVGAKPERVKQEIKAVTYHELEIVEGEDGFQATVVFDI